MNLKKRIESVENLDGLINEVFKNLKKRIERLCVLVLLGRPQSRNLKKRIESINAFGWSSALVMP